MYELDKEAFGRFLAGLRKEKGLTQRQLAERLFVSDKAVSKWERGLSLPDTALLIPLAEALEVTVTELLLCRRCPAAEPIAPDTVEHAVKAAIRYPDSIHTSKRAWQQRPRGIVWFAAALAAGAAGVYANFRLGNPHAETVQLLAIMAAVFGAYFWLLVPVRLPDFYDENQLGFFWDYILRINVPGVAFNNTNWPRIVRALRVWSCLVPALLPLVNLALGWLFSAFRPSQLYLLLFLGSLFGPLYIAGRP